MVWVSVTTSALCGQFLPGCLSDAVHVNTLPPVTLLPEWMQEECKMKARWKQEECEIKSKMKARWMRDESKKYARWKQEECEMKAKRMQDESKKNIRWKQDESKSQIYTACT